VAKSRGNRSADFFVAVASALFRVGLDLDYELSANPAHEIRRLAQSQSYPPWPFAARAAFLAAALPEWVRTCYMLGIWTTLRLSDVLTLPRSAFDGQGLAVTHGKTKRSGYIPAHSDLRAYLAELKPRGTIWVLDERGKPVSQTRASHAFREVLDGLGYPDLSFHGLRHTAATALAEAGASPQMIQAITGHQTSVMVEHYTRRREQKRLASEGMAKLEGTGTERETGKRPP
jgi:integrase